MKSDATNSQHYGFNKISLVTAAVILAKQSGFAYVAKPFDRGDEIVLDPKTFSWNIFPETPEKLFNDSDLEFLHFSPKLYVYSDFEVYASEKVRNIVRHIENFPEALGYPIFDHIRVLVAGVDYRKNSFRFSSGEEFRSDYEERISSQLNFELVSQKQVAAALIGEKYGENYFISYCMP
jgi:hypothetical protein